MTRSLLVVLTLLFSAAAHGVSFHPCTKSDGEIMYSNIPCDCFQFPDQSRVYNANCPLMGMPTAAQNQRAFKRMQKQDASRSNATEKARESTEISRIENEKRQIESKKQKVLEEMARSSKNLGSKSFGSLLEFRLSLVQKRLELIAINNELRAKDRELDKYRSPEEVALLNAKRARAQQNRKDVAEQQLRQNRQEQRSEEMERKIDDIADKLGVW
jgi:hypothetical protein